MIQFNISQRKALSAFLNNIAAAWFVGLFVAPRLSTEFDTLIILRYLVNIIGALYLSLSLLKNK